MKIEIYTKEIELTKKLEEYIESKINSLNNILGKNDEERKCDFRIGKNSKSHLNGKIYFAEARVETPNKAYGAKANAESINEAIDNLKDEIQTKIRRNKDKRDSLLKRGGRKIKSLLKFGR